MNALSPGTNALRVIGLSSALVLGTVTPAAALDWRQAWHEPQNTSDAMHHGDAYAWRLFVALNWPADVPTRTADSKGVFGADRPAVWETWPNANDIYRSDGADPGPFAAEPGPVATEPRNTAARFETLSPKELPNPRHVVGGVMVPLVDPIANAARLTEIHVNRAAYEFIRARELYNLDGQIQAYQSGEPATFPAGAKEIKAKWRRISAAERARYHTLEVTLADGSRRLYGLTALHIATKDLPSWFWATFEHVDNRTLPGGDGWQLASRDEFACAGTAADCDDAPRGIGLEGTVWQYYRLRGTLGSFVDREGRPRLLANSELETGMQQSSSCITCHSRAAISVIFGEVIRLPIFATADDPPGNASTRRGFVGMPAPQWFAGGDTAGPHGPAFQQQDFDWSMAKAQPKVRRHNEE